MSALKPPDDLEIRRAQKQDKDAIERVLEKSAPYVLALCKTWCRPPLEAADIAQESLLRVAQSIKSFRQDSAFFTWVYTLTYRTFLDHARTQARRASLAPMQSLELSPDVDKNSTYDSESGNAAAAVSLALEALEPIHREVLILIDVQGSSYDQVSIDLAIPVGTVRSRLARARLNLRKILIEQGTFSPSGDVLPSEESQ